MNLPFVLLGTLGQPKIWDITNPASYQHPMAPYDVLVDPQTVPNVPKINHPDELASKDDYKELDKVNEVSVYNEFWPSFKFMSAGLSVSFFSP